MDDEDEKLLVAGGVILLAYFGIVKPLLNAVGVNPADTAVVNNISTTSNANNPFTYYYQPFVDAYSGNWATYGGVIGWMQALQQSFNNGTLTNQAAPLVFDAEALYSDAGYFRTDADGIIAIFNSLTSKSDVAYIAGYLFANYDVDLLTFLRNGKQLFHFGLSDTQIAQIIAHINTLPDA